MLNQDRPFWNGLILAIDSLWTLGHSASATGAGAHMLACEMEGWLARELVMHLAPISSACVEHVKAFHASPAPDVSNQVGFGATYPF